MNIIYIHKKKYESQNMFARLICSKKILVHSSGADRSIESSLHTLFGGKTKTLFEDQFVEARR